MKLLQEIKIEVSDDGHLWVNGVDTHQAVRGGNEEMRIAQRNGFAIEVQNSFTDKFGVMFDVVEWRALLQYRTAIIPQQPKKVPMTREDIEAMIVSKRTWGRDISIATNGDTIVGFWCELDSQGLVNRVLKDMGRYEYSHDLKAWHKFEKEVQP